MLSYTFPLVLSEARLGIIENLPHRRAHQLTTPLLHLLVQGRVMPERTTGDET